MSKYQAVFAGVLIDVGIVFCLSGWVYLGLVLCGVGCLLVPEDV